MKKGKKCLVYGLLAAAVLTVGGIVWKSQTLDKEEEAVYKETTVEHGTLTVGVTESGSVSIGTLTQDVDFEESSSTSSQGSTQSTGSGASGSAMASVSQNSSSANSTSLEVEEVYVSVGQVVAEGDALMKLSSESVNDYREMLKETVQTATTAVSSAKLSAEKQTLEAGYSYDKSIAEGSVANAQYEATIKELQDAVDAAQEKVDTSSSLINYYKQQIASGVDLSSSLASEEENYEKLLVKLTAAQNNYTTKSIEAEETLKKAQLSEKNAQSQYNVDISGVDSAIEEAEETLQDAKEALEEFETFVGEEGIIYSDYAGVITEIGYEEGDTLSSQNSIVTVADADAVTMTVSVSEEDIADISIGDVVEITLTAYEDRNFSGVVQNVDTSVSSGSSTVSYNVTVAFTDDTNGVYTDMTGNVTFIEKQVEDVLYVSNKAIIQDGVDSYVKVKDADGTIRKTAVTTGFSDGVNVEISSGLSEGETVLIESQVSAQ